MHLGQAVKQIREVGSNFREKRYLIELHWTKPLTFEVRGAPLAARPVEAEGRNKLDRGVRWQWGTVCHGAASKPKAQYRTTKPTTSEKRNPTTPGIIVGNGTTSAMRKKNLNGCA